MKTVLEALKHQKSERNEYIGASRNFCSLCCCSGSVVTGRLFGISSEIKKKEDRGLKELTNSECPLLVVMFLRHDHRKILYFICRFF